MLSDYLGTYKDDLSRDFCNCDLNHIHFGKYSDAHKIYGLGWDLDTGWYPLSFHPINKGSALYDAFKYLYLTFGVGFCTCKRLYVIGAVPDFSLNDPTGTSLCPIHKEVLVRTVDWSSLMDKLCKSEDPFIINYKLVEDYCRKLGKYV